MSFRSDMMEFCTVIAPQLVVGVQLKHQPILNMKCINGIGVDRVNQVRVNIMYFKEIHYSDQGTGMLTHG